MRISYLYLGLVFVFTSSCKPSTTTTTSRISDEEKALEFTRQMSQVIEVDYPSGRISSEDVSKLELQLTRQISDATFQKIMLGDYSESVKREFMAFWITGRESTLGPQVIANIVAKNVEAVKILTFVLIEGFLVRGGRFRAKIEPLANEYKEFWGVEGNKKIRCPYILRTSGDAHSLKLLKSWTTTGTEQQREEAKAALRSSQR